VLVNCSHKSLEMPVFVAFVPVFGLWKMGIKQNVLQMFIVLLLLLLYCMIHCLSHGHNTPKTRHAHLRVTQSVPAQRSPIRSTRGATRAGPDHQWRPVYFCYRQNRYQMPCSQSRAQCS
jgi:hypothetical protein